MRFEKWQALGNDYVIVERPELPFELTAGRIRRICEPHFGVGADGVLLIWREPEGTVTGGLRIFNPDGSEAELSGNGAREAALYMHSHGWSASTSFTIGTPAGEVRPTVTGARTCTIDMGRASTASGDFPDGPPDGRGELSAAGRTWSFQHVSIGNPQCSIQMPDREALEALELGALGAEIEAHPLFPRRTNVSWYAELGENHIRARIFERGVGETLASGTGAAGAAIAQLLRTGTGAGSVRVQLDGGELEVEVGGDLGVRQSGWAVAVFAGTLSQALVEQLRTDDQAERA